MHLRINNGILRSIGRLPMKYSGALSTRHYILWIFKYAIRLADQLGTIHDHQLFLGALICFSQSAEPNWDVRALYSVTIRFYPTDEI